MALLRIGDRRFDIDVVVFDKDGTLIDFHLMWGQRARAAVQALVRESGGDGELQTALYRTLGYEPETGATAGTGPLAVVPLHKTDVVMATVLFQHGRDWHEAERLVREVFSPLMSGEPTTETVRPLGQVRGAMERLSGRGVRTAMATTDDRAPTLRTLGMLGIDGHFELLYCGDDDLPQKPSAAVLEHIAGRCGVAVDRVMMVGDTVGDLSMARAAGAGAGVGVLGGATDEATLAEWSSALISSVDEIEVL